MSNYEKYRENCTVKPAPNNITEIVFILDRSGSMHGLEKDTIGSFNSLIESQKKEEGDAFVTTILFNSKHQIIHDRTDIKSIRPMTDSDYQPNGCTALLDAVGYAINHISNIHKYSRAEDIPFKTVFAITTDGMENASQQYSYADIKKLIESKKELGWEFIFTAANIDVKHEGAKMGINANMCVSFEPTSAGIAEDNAYLDDVIKVLRRNGTVF